MLILYPGAPGEALIVLIALGFMNPLYAVAPVLLFLPGWLLIKSSYVKMGKAGPAGVLTAYPI